VPTLGANGLEIGYDVHGAGPPLVALHGATSLGREDYAAQIPILSKAFLLHLPDARGHGRSRWDAADGFRYDWLVDDLQAFVDGLGLDSFHLLGFSMGAMTALQLAARVPRRVRTLVVVGITPQREPRASVGRRLMDPQRILATDPGFAATLARRHDAGQGQGAWQRLLPAIAADIAVQPLLTPAELHAIDCPTMVVCGDRDPFVPPEHAAALVRQLPAGQLFVVPGCGHEVPARRPGLFNEALGGFYRATEAEARRRAALIETPGIPTATATSQGGPA
jgi:pimeloyl-ACP methyl ester carboxylesterase